jgi:hypothetical protein
MGHDAILHYERVCCTPIRQKFSFVLAAGLEEQQGITESGHIILLKK